MSKVLFDDDRSFYNLGQLKLCEVLSDDVNCSYEVVAGRKFKVIGKGGFGSIFVGTIPKTRESSTRGYDHDTSTLGWYHGVLLQGRKSSEPCSERGDFSKRDVEASTCTSAVSVAVKRTEVSAEQQSDFHRELLTLNALWGRRNFVANYGATFSRDLGCVCIVLELVDGCTLNQFLQTRGSAAAALNADQRVMFLSDAWKSNEILWWMEKMRLFREIVLGLIQCHSLQVYHGDLKGANILIDRSLVPKVIDFGMSFRRVDKSYMRELGGSLLWVAPEIVEDPRQISEAVLNNPYPSDVYSLGVVLAEVLVDGEVPESVTQEYILCLKAQGESPIDLIDVRSDDISFEERILGRLKGLVENCCCEDRDQRISLSEVLTAVDDVYEELCQSSFDLPAATWQTNIYDPHELNDRQFIQCQGYKDMLDKSRRRFPSVREHLLLRPSRNPVMDEYGNLLVHHFCKLDFTEGVQYLVEKSSWGFQAEQYIPYMSLECVRGGSTSTLRYLETSWPDIMREQLLLVHEACKYCHDDHDGRDLLQVLLNMGIDFETWEYFDKPNGYLDLLLPIQKLAIWGKKEMLRTLLEYCELHPERVSNRVFDVDLAEAVFLSVREDQIETMDLLLEGKRLKVVDDILDHKDFDLHSRLEPCNPKHSLCTTLFGALFAIAVSGDSFPKLKVAIALLERDYGNSLGGGHVILEQKRRAVTAPKHLKVLKDFVAGLACSPTKDPAMAACRKGNEEVIDALFWLMAPLGGLASRGASSVPTVVHDMVFRIASHGSKLMVDIIKSHGVRFHAYQQVSGTAFTHDSKLMEGMKLGNHDKLTLLDVSCIYNNKEITDYLLLQPPRVTSVLMRTLGDTHPEKLPELDDGTKKLHAPGDTHREKLPEPDEGTEKLHAPVDRGKVPYAKILVLLDAYGLNLDRLVLRLQAVARNHWSQADAPCQEVHCQSSMSMVNNSPQVRRPKLSLWTEKVRYEHTLHSAAFYGKVDIVKYLLKRGFPVDFTMKEWYMGSTALFRACESKASSREERKVMVKTLLEAGANPNHKNGGGYTAMDVVLGSSDGWRELFHLLVQAGFNLGDLNHAGESYMSLARREFDQPRE